MTTEYDLDIHTPAGRLIETWCAKGVQEEVR